MSEKNPPQEHAKDSMDKNDTPLAAAIRELSEIVRVIMLSQERQTVTHERMLRRDLRWRVLRAALICVALIGGALIYSFGLQHLLAPREFTGPYASLVRIEGTIEAEQRANARRVNASLQAAFSDEHSKGIVLEINSPGGSAVQSSLIYDQLRALRKQYPNTPVWAVGEDMLTSGAYFIATASDNVCVNRSTMTGSIGVIMSGWGLDRAIERFQVERRVLTAGSHKNRLDTFLPMRADDKAKAEQLLDRVHEHFIEAVKAGRGERLKGDPKELFSGDYWTGAQALELGLVDELCDMGSVLQKLGVKQVKDFTAPPNVWTALANSFGVIAEQWFSTAAFTPQPRFLP